MSDELSDQEKRIVAIAAELCDFKNPAHSECVGLALVAMRDLMSTHWDEFASAAYQNFANKHTMVVGVEIDFNAEKAICRTSLKFPIGGKVADERQDVTRNTCKMNDNQVDMFRDEPEDDQEDEQEVESE